MPSSVNGARICKQTVFVHNFVWRAVYLAAAAGYFQQQILKETLSDLWENPDVRIAHLSRLEVSRRRQSARSGKNMLQRMGKSD